MGNIYQRWFEQLWDTERPAYAARRDALHASCEQLKQTTDTLQLSAQALAARHQELEQALCTLRDAVQATEQARAQAQQEQAAAHTASQQQWQQTCQQALSALRTAHGLQLLAELSRQAPELVAQPLALFEQALQTRLHEIQKQGQQQIRACLTALEHLTQTQTAHRQTQRQQQQTVQTAQAEARSLEKALQDYGVQPEVMASLWQLSDRDWQQAESELNSLQRDAAYEQQIRVLPANAYPQPG
jgi:hypothetical protein